MDKLRQWLAGTQPQTSPEAAGTSQPQQQANNNIGTINASNIGVLNVGSVVGNHQNEEKEGSRIPVDIDGLDLTGLKKYYRASLCKTVPLPWHTGPAWSIHEIYTELSLHDSEKPNFGVEKLFDHAKERFPEDGIYRILIEGNAGYGKSTLMLKITSDWSKRDSNDPKNYTDPFTVLFIVKLSSVGEDGKILSYMDSIYEEKMGKKVEDLLKSKGAEKVLILLDGYDDANAKTQKEVRQIMEKEMLSKCHVVLTSRFGYVSNEIKSKTLPVKVHGFGRKQVAEAVGKFYIKAGHVTKADVISCVKELLGESCAGNKPDDLLSIDDLENVQDDTKPLPADEGLSRLDQFKKFMRKVLDKSPHKELALCPLLCVMLCCLASESSNSELPSTIPGLYFALINRNLYRAARKKAKAAGKEEFKWNWKALESRIHNDHEKYLQEFGRLCVNGLKNRSLSFTLFELLGNGIQAEPANVKVAQLIEAGVLVQDLTELNANEDLYEVPHRTMAEFLAAYYLSTKTNQTYWFRLLGFAEKKDSFQHDTLKGILLSDVYNAAATYVVESEKHLSTDSRLKLLLNFFAQVGTRLTTILTVNMLGAAGTWSELKMLPNKLQTGIKILQMKVNDDVVFVNAIINSSEPSLILLQMVEMFNKVYTGNRNDQRSLAKGFRVPLHGKINQNLEETWNNGTVLRMSDITWNLLEFEVEDYIQGDGTNSQLEFVRNFTALFNYRAIFMLSFANAPDVIFSLLHQHVLEYKSLTRLGIVALKVLIELCLLFLSLAHLYRYWLILLTLLFFYVTLNIFS